MTLIEMSEYVTTFPATLNVVSPDVKRLFVARWMVKPVWSVPLYVQLRTTGDFVGAAWVSGESVVAPAGGATVAGAELAVRVG